jgi:hypothetical protein
VAVELPEGVVDATENILSSSYTSYSFISSS